MSDYDMSDHDLLISLFNKVESIKSGVDSFAPVIKSLDDRLKHIEQGNARHSERLTALRGEVDALKIDKLNRAEIESIKQDVDDLQKKSDTWNVINSIAIGIVTLVATVFRK